MSIERQPGLDFGDTQTDSEGIPLHHTEAPDEEDLIHNPVVEERKNPRTTLSDLKKIAGRMRRGEDPSSAITKTRQERKGLDEKNITD